MVQGQNIVEEDADREKPHKVLTFPGPDIQPYKTKPVVKTQEIDFLGDGWIKFY